jgi:tetraacyldisaccharide 4'-kinase
MLSESDLLPVWYGNRPPPLRLRFLSVIYAWLTAIRRWLYRRGLCKSVRLSVPVVVVGNISVGGTGKTPLTIALIHALRSRGFSPGVVSRGHGGSARGTYLLDAKSQPAVVGDEPVLVAQATGAPVAVGRDRVAAARLLLAQGGVDVVIADDGLQHYALARNVEICVIDGERRFGNSRLLPAGPLREPVARLEQCDFRVCNGGTPAPGETAMTLSGDFAQTLGVRTSTRALQEFRAGPLHAVAGIGNPARFFQQLRAAGLTVHEHAFADHHAYRAGDLEFGDDLPVLMTEKDAVKCRAFAQSRYWCVPVRAQLSDEFFDAVAARLKGAT